MNVFTENSFQGQDFQRVKQDMKVMEQEENPSCWLLTDVLKNGWNINQAQATSSER